MVCADGRVSEAVFCFLEIQEFARVCIVSLFDESIWNHVVSEEIIATAEPLSTYLNVDGKWGGDIPEPSVGMV